MNRVSDIDFWNKASVSQGRAHGPPGCNSVAYLLATTEVKRPGACLRPIAFPWESVAEMVFSERNYLAAVNATVSLREEEGSLLTPELADE